MNIAIYARLATRGQVDDGRLANQIQSVREWATTNNHFVVKTFVDDGASGFDEMRPEYGMMIAEATSQSHPFDAIAVHSLSRLHRDADRLAQLERLLSTHKVKLVCINQRDADLGVSDAQRKIRAHLWLFQQLRQK